MTDQEFLDWVASPGARRVLLVEATALVSSVETPLYLSDKPFTSESTDTPASTAYESCVVGGISFAESVSLTLGASSVSYGTLKLANPGGERDAWRDYVWANRQVRMYVGDAQWERADFRLVFDGVVQDMAPPSDAESLSLVLTDKLQRLNNPITETTLGGSSNNKDKLLPLSFGESFNVLPLCTNQATLRYMVHNGPIEDIIEVRSNGYAPVTITKFISTGEFMLSANPANTTITASVQGAKPAAGTYAGYSTNISTLCQLIATAYGPSATRFSSGDLDAASLAAFAAAHTQPVGLNAADRMNQLEAMQRLAGSVGAQVVCTTLGKMRLVQVALTGASGTALGAEDFEYHSLREIGRPEVRPTCKLGYARNVTPQTALAAGLVAASVPLYTEEWLTVTSTDAPATADYNKDTAPQMEETCLLVASDAQTEADRRRDLWKTQRVVYGLTAYATKMLLELGDPVTLTHDRFGLSGGATGIVVSIERDWLNARVKLGVLV